MPLPAYATIVITWFALPDISAVSSSGEERRKDMRSSTGRYTAETAPAEVRLARAWYRQGCVSSVHASRSPPG